MPSYTNNFKVVQKEPIAVLHRNGDSPNTFTELRSKMENETAKICIRN